MTDPIYCYYHPYMRLEITQQHGGTYAVCPECRDMLTYVVHGECKCNQQPTN